MNATPEQIAAASKANVETIFNLTSKAFEGLEQLINLNLTASRAALADAAAHTQALLSAKDAQEMLALQASALQPIAEKTAAYSRHLYDIASAAGAEVGKTVETKSAEAQKTISSLVDAASRNAPAGSETAVAVMKSAVAAANNVADSLQKAARQASDMMEANVNTLSAQAASAARTASSATTAAARKRA
ncbi:TIGR01841 family phasin [Xylophilus rhododendri]|uniref:TIGR01841 family phasin n=1 Tax=Xylophilus rhododendri TaxID=2697032 RepID=A0A857J585_9BURK|nr:phasin family protein [Xylophilus rhododendri]QHI98008.1 TIGR01841 family phasin [Xylophilus rhododendri]